MQSDLEHNAVKLASACRAMQSVCSLRLQHVQFKHSTQTWRQRRLLPSRQTSLQTQAHHLSSTASRTKTPRRSTVCSDAAVPHIPLPGDNQTGAMFAALSQDEDSTSSSDSEDAHPFTSKSTSNGRPPDNKPEPRIPHRWRIIGMMALAFVLCNMDKVNMSVAVIPMAEELGWSATDRGLVSSAFFWGYALTQIPAGYISTKVGGAKVLLLGVLLWSIGTLAAPPLAHISLFALCASRVFVGLGEGLAPSSATNVMARLIPERERSRAVTAVFGGLDVGSAVGLVLCGPIIKHLGWPSVFYLFAFLGVLWTLLFPRLNPDEPDMLVPSELQPDSPDAPKAVPWGLFAKSAPVWAIITAHFCFNWGYYTLLAWLPSYFELALGLSVDKSSLLTLIPYIAMTAMTPFVGPVADGLVTKGWSVTHVRKLAQGLAFAGPASCMLACAYLTPAGASHTAAALGQSVPTSVIVGLLSVSFALGAWSRAGLYCNHQDLSPKYAGALLGITNTAGAFPGILGVSAVGLLLDKTNSWADALFLPTAACQLVGLVVYTTFASSKRQDWA